MADLANLVNEAASLGGRNNKLVVDKIDFILWSAQWLYSLSLSLSLSVSLCVCNANEGV